MIRDPEYLDLLRRHEHERLYASHLRYRSCYPILWQAIEKACNLLAKGDSYTALDVLRSAKEKDELLWNEMSAEYRSLEKAQRGARTRLAKKVREKKC